MVTHVPLTILIALAALLALSLASLSAWSRRAVHVRVIALVLGISFVPLFGFATYDLLSRPKMMTVGELGSERTCAAVLHATIRERQGIYLFLQFPEIKEPRYVAVPWNLKFAQALVHMERVAEHSEHGGTIIVGKGCQNGGLAKISGIRGILRNKKNGGRPGNEEGEFKFYPDPVPPSPPKDYSPFYSTPLRLPDQQ